MSDPVDSRDMERRNRAWGDDGDQRVQQGLGVDFVTVRCLSRLGKVVRQQQVRPAVVCSRLTVIWTDRSYRKGASDVVWSHYLLANLDVERQRRQRRRLRYVFDASADLAFVVEVVQTGLLAKMNEMTDC
jgi:hypothetical protein